MITIHHLLISQSERVIWLMEELGLSYDLKTHRREPTGMAPPIFLELHPIGIAPVIQDGGVTLAESLAIFTYILDLYGDGKLRIAPRQPGYADYVYWFHYASAGFMPQTMARYIASMAGAGEGTPLEAALSERFSRHLGMINDRLAKNHYLAGDTFTAADIMLHFPFATLSAHAPIDISDYPHIRTWLDRISQRPAYQRAMKSAGHERDPAA
jgi:glutathione S-transferase